MDCPHFNTVLINNRSISSALAAVADRLCVWRCVRLSIHSHYNEETYRKKCLTPHVFAYIYKLMYAYVYPYNHKNMFLGCPGRGPGTWYRLWTARTLRKHEKMQVLQCHQNSYYSCICTSSGESRGGLRTILWRIRYGPSGQEYIKTKLNNDDGDLNAKVGRQTSSTLEGGGMTVWTGRTKLGRRTLVKLLHWSWLLLEQHWVWTSSAPSIYMGIVKISPTIANWTMQLLR